MPNIVEHNCVYLMSELTKTMGKKKKKNEEEISSSGFAEPIALAWSCMQLKGI